MESLGEVATSFHCKPKTMQIGWSFQFALSVLGRGGGTNFLMVEGLFIPNEFH